MTFCRVLLNTAAMLVVAGRSAFTDAYAVPAAAQPTTSRTGGWRPAPDGGPMGQPDTRQNLFPVRTPRAGLHGGSSVGDRHRFGKRIRRYARSSKLTCPDSTPLAPASSATHHGSALEEHRNEK
ncbi:hypothetical protein Asi03nite_71780 [Actinoplanes siamensis]|uniref:Secreted protein n=1 Tax=Actinoplanes siamensis TaxID=1223317 RepID=A0A919TQA2_9ACTN|nr:hypothetical protein Asi03nite_71780 [Actinoplanes siamensis]